MFYRVLGWEMHSYQKLVHKKVGAYSEVPTPFLIYTDAYSFKYIVNLKSDKTIFQHWYADLAQLQFIVIHGSY